MVWTGSTSAPSAATPWRSSRRASACRRSARSPASGTNAVDSRLRLQRGAVSRYARARACARHDGVRAPACSGPDATTRTKWTWTAGAGGFRSPAPTSHSAFRCRWKGAGPAVDDAAKWRCAFTYNAHTHRFRVSEMVSVGYRRGEQGTRQYSARCDRKAPCPERDRRPSTRIISAPQGVVSSATATLLFRSSEAGSTFQCRLNRRDWAPCRSRKRLRALPDGRKMFGVRAIDDRGKIDPTPARRRWRVDTSGSRLTTPREPRR